MVLMIIGESGDEDNYYYIDNFALREGWVQTVDCSRSNLQYADEDSRYRFGFNGMERENELNPSITSAEYWMYNGRLGRRWNVDPKENEWESFYATLGNNPLKNVDIKGDKWKTTADETKAKELNTSLKTREKELLKTAENLQQKLDGLLQKGKVDKDNNLTNMIEEARVGVAEMNLAQIELNNLSESATDFTFKDNTGNNISYAYMNTDGTIVIEYASDANAIHELTYAHQHLTGKIEFVAGIGASRYNDATDEIAAYKRQYFFSSTSVTGLTTDSQFGIKTSRDIGFHWLINLWSIDKNGAKVYPYRNFSPNQRDKPASK